MEAKRILLGSHVGMSGRDMLLGSAKEAVSYGANTFMIYTGAPQNTRRKEIKDLNIEAGWDYMQEHGIAEIVIHAPYIINLGNSVKPEIFQLAVEFLAKEMERTQALRSQILVLHPGSHVGEGAARGIEQIAKGLNEVLTRDTEVYIALETMAGKGSEVGRSFEELAQIYDRVQFNEKLRVCFDTCHTHDAGYDIVNDFEGVMEDFDRRLGKEQIAVFHINDSKNQRGAAKDRHENIGFGYIGYQALRAITLHPDFENIPKILETPYIPDPDAKAVSYAPYAREIEMLKAGRFEDEMKQQIIKEGQTKEESPYAGA